MTAHFAKTGNDRLTDKASVKNRLRGLLDPLVGALARLGVTPIAVTVAGLALSLAGAALVARGSLLSGGLVLVAAGVCDTLDGSLARRAGRESVFGAFIDSTVDRVAEIAVFGGLILHYVDAGPGGRLPVIACLVALMGAFLTSYTRARAEGLGFECRVGLIERPERVALIILGLVIGGKTLAVILGLLALLTVVTALQRVIHVRRLAAAKDRSAA